MDFPRLWLAAAALAALAGCARPELAEGQHLGLVAAREAVTLAGPGGPTPAWAWTVKLDGGRRTTVVQAAPMFSIGQRVMVTTGDGPPRMAIP